MSEVKTIERSEAERIRFGTGGWRAVIGDGFTRRNIQVLAKAMADKVKAEGTADEEIVIGYDRRFLSKEAVMWTCEVLAAEGIHTAFINHSSPTPLIMYYVEAHNLHYGMMVTASHNPALYNGIKVFTKGGRDATADQTKDIETYIAAVDHISYMDYAEAKRTGWVREFNPINEYLDNIISNINMPAIRERQLRIVLDPMYGVSENSLRTILGIARCELSVIHGTHDTLFGRRMPAPSEASLSELKTYVLEMECDLGIATDGDADRLGVIDDAGHYLSANEILCLLYYYLLKYKKWHGAAVRNAATTQILDRIAARFGEECYEVPVGFKYISEKMQQTNALIGGESSGGLTVRGHINGKDGVYAASILVEMVAVSGKKLSELREELYREFGTSYVEEYGWHFPAERKAELQEMLRQPERFPAFPSNVQKVCEPDGCKIYFENGGWLIARFSGTEPLLRIFCEMASAEEAKEYVMILANYLEGAAQTN